MEDIRSMYQIVNDSMKIYELLPKSIKIGIIFNSRNHS